MKAKTVTIDFGHVFPTDAEDRDKLVREVEKNVTLNTNTILDDGAYRHMMNHKPDSMRLRVTVELVEG